MDSGRTSDIERLNALIDGELEPSERADLAARLASDRELAAAYATLARLKAVTVEAAGDGPAIALRRPRSLMLRRHLAAIAACVVLAIGGAILVSREWPTAAGPAGDAAEGPTEIVLASLPTGTTVPRLDSAGLKLVHLAFSEGTTPPLRATYRGPHGCRLDLMVWPATADAPAASGTSSYRWMVGSLAYELTAHGMPDWRFRVITDAAEQQTRAGADHDRIDRRLREANRGAPPCVG